MITRLHRLFLIALPLFLGTQMSWSQTPYLDAHLAYQAGDYKVAYEGFVELAQAGDPDAMTNVAIMFDNGQGVEQNVRRAA